MGCKNFYVSQSESRRSRCISSHTPDKIGAERWLSRLLEDINTPLSRRARFHQAERWSPDFLASLAACRPRCVCGRRKTRRAVSGPFEFRFCNELACLNDPSRDLDGALASLNDEFLRNRLTGLDFISSRHSGDIDRNCHVLFPAAAAALGRRDNSESDDGFDATQLLLMKLERTSALTDGRHRSITPTGYDR